MLLASRSVHPSLAPGFPEDPVAHDLLREAEGHHDDAEGEVGDGERRHEPGRMAGLMSFRVAVNLKARRDWLGM